MKIDKSHVIFRPLERSEIALMLELQNEVLQENELNRETLRKNTYEDFDVCFTKCSLVLGAFFNEHFIGYGILFYAEQNKENLAYCLDEPGNLADYANVKVIVVKKEYRGNGLQTMFLKLLEAFAKEQLPVKTLLCTVSPKNKFSSDNFMKSGYQFVKTVKKYGGLDRCLYRKDI